MSMPLTYLWQNLYKVVDQVIDTGEPVTIERNGVKLNIVLSPTDNPEEDVMSSVIQNQNTTTPQHNQRELERGEI